MKSFFKLVQNELLKIWHQNAYRILIFIMLAVFFLIPVFSTLSNFVISTDWFAYNISESIEDYEKYMSYATESAEREYYSARISALKDFKDRNFDISTWQYKMFYFSYESIVLKEYYYRALKDNYGTENEKYWLKDEWFNIGYGGDGSDIDELYQEAIKERKEFLSFCENAKIIDIYEKEAKIVDNSISVYEYELQNVISDIETSNTDKLRCKKEHLEIYIEALKEMRASYDALIKNEYEYGSWQQVTVFSIMSTIVNDISNYTMISEDDFNNEIFYKEEYGNYSEYVKIFETEREKKLNTIKSLHYSVENNIPTQSSQTVSAKSVFRSSIFSQLSVITLFLIIVASIIVASEFSSGSARLLFSKPHSRTKILFSKYVAVLALGGAMIIAGVILAFIGTIITNGAGDLFKPDLVVSNGKIVESICFKSILWALILAQFKIVFLISLVFFMSALIKKSAIAILSGFIINSVFSVINSLSELFGKNIFKFTIFPYYNMENFAGNYLEYYAYNAYSANILIPDYVKNYQFASTYNGWVGFGIYALILGLILTVTFTVFSKSEIKN